MVQDDLTRANAFERVTLERTSTDVVPFDGGVAFLNRTFAQRYDSNLLWVEDPADAPVERWLAEAERILGSRGYRHRKVVVPDRDAQRRLEVGFADHGYAVDRVVLMVQRAQPERSPDLSSVEEVAFDEAQPMLESIARHQPWSSGDNEARELTAFRAMVARSQGARVFASRVDGRLVGCCELHIQGDAAEIDAVDTMEEFRNRGLASAFVLAATAAAHDAGAPWVHLWADADDWPQHWYRRLGFVPVATVADFLRWPPEGGPPGSGDGLVASEGGKSPDRG
jgi:GNAT superfamily N-acetyltransferase